MNRLVERNENKTSEVDAYKNLLEIIPSIPHAIPITWPRQTRRPAKRHVAKKLPEVHGNY